MHRPSIDIACNVPGRKRIRLIEPQTMVQPGPTLTHDTHPIRVFGTAIAANQVTETSTYKLLGRMNVLCCHCGVMHWMEVKHVSILCGSSCTVWDKTVSMFSQISSTRNFSTATKAIAL